MSKARNLARLLVDSSGDISSDNLGNAPNPITPGTIAYIGKSTAPDGWLKANGATISRTTYAALFAEIGTTFGAGDGSTTFALPDLRGEFPRGWDDGRGVDSGRELGSTQGDAIRNMTGTFMDTSAGDTVGFHGGGGTTGVLHTVSQSSTYRQQLEVASGGRLRFDASRQVPTALENRPRSIALLACIKF